MIFLSFVYGEPSLSPQPPNLNKSKNQLNINQKELFNNKYPNINIAYYTKATIKLLELYYPKYCPVCNILMTQNVGDRETSCRCPKCKTQASRTSYTPLHHFKLPLWVFGYLLHESIIRHPQVVSGADIIRRLGVAKNTAVYLKRRLQVFLTDITDYAKEHIRKELEKTSTYRLPQDPNTDLTHLIKERNVAYMDTVALFSASQRANKGRKRFKHHGQTSSIYLSDKVALETGKYQVGTLVHTIAFKQGLIFFDSIPDQKQRTIQPLLNFMPKDSIMFTDEGYPWLKRYNKNHRAINHSAKSKDKRYRYARDRWVKNGVSNQVAEGIQRSINYSFVSGYSYVSPQYGQLYLNEFSGLRALKVLGNRLGCGDSAGGMRPLSQ